MVYKIDELKSEIALTFMRTQNLIISSYFDNAFNAVSTLEEVESYRKKLYTFRDYIGTTEGYTFFDDYYVNKMEQLEKKYNAIENGEEYVFETALKVITKKESKLAIFFKKLKSLIFGTSKESESLKG